MTNRNKTHKKYIQNGDITYIKCDFVKEKEMYLESIIEKVVKQVGIDGELLEELFSIIRNNVTKQSIVAGLEIEKEQRETKSWLKVEGNEIKVKKNATTKDKAFTELRELIEDIYINQVKTDSDLGIFRGKLFERVIESYIEVHKEKLGIIGDIFYGTGIGRKKTNKPDLFRNVCSVEKKKTGKKCTRGTADIVAEKLGKMILVELKVSPYGFDCPTLHYLINAKKYIQNCLKIDKEVMLLCLSTEGMTEIVKQIKTVEKNHDVKLIDKFRIVEFEDLREKCEDGY